MYLVVGRLVFEAWLVEDGFDLILVEVGDADGLDQISIHQLLHPLRKMAKKKKTQTLNLKEKYVVYSLY